jgi:ketosteroid isomerase-like protein
MERSHIEVVRNIYEAFGQRDLAAVLPLVSSDIQISQSRALPWGGDYAGLKGLEQFLTRLLTHVDSRVEIAQWIDAGEHVVAIGRTVGVVRSNRNPFDVPVAHLWRLSSGRITGFFPHIENATMLKALNPPTTATP